MKLLDDYFKIQKEIYDYFGYEEEWSVLHIKCSTDYYWYTSDCSVSFSKNKDTKKFEYEDGLLSNKSIFRGRDYTMIKQIDTHTDSNKYLQVFDNKKEIHDRKLTIKE